MAPTDAQLMRDSRKDPSAFTGLVARHLATVHRYAARRLGPTDAEDVASEVFAIAYAARDRYDDSRADALPWLYGIATNVIRGQRRKERNQLRAYAASHVSPGSAEPDSGDLGPALATALAAMRPNHRDAICLYALAELSYEEVAFALGVPVGTVRGWISRARETATRELASLGIRTQVAVSDAQVVEP